MLFRSDYLLGRTMSRDGSVIDMSELADGSEAKDNQLKGSASAMLRDFSVSDLSSRSSAFLISLLFISKTPFVSGVFSCCAFIIHDSE